MHQCQLTSLRRPSDCILRISSLAAFANESIGAAVVLTIQQRRRRYHVADQQRRRRVVGIALPCFSRGHNHLGRILVAAGAGAPVWGVVLPIFLRSPM